MTDDNGQGDLFDAHTRARSSDPDTSHDAAGRIVRRINPLQIKVLAYFLSIYPEAITDYDLEAHFDDHGSTYRTRRAELVEMGLIEDTLERRIQDGSPRILWRATRLAVRSAASKQAANGAAASEKGKSNE